MKNGFSLRSKGKGSARVLFLPLLLCCLILLIGCGKNGGEEISKEQPENVSSGLTEGAESAEENESKTRQEEGTKAAAETRREQTETEASGQVDLTEEREETAPFMPSGKEAEATQVPTPAKTEEETQVPTPEKTEEATQSPFPEKTAEATQMPSPVKPVKETQDTSAKAATEKPQDTPPPSSSHQHSYSVTVTRAASCGAAGVKTYTCSCGAGYTETIPASGDHSWAEQFTTVHHDALTHIVYHEAVTHTVHHEAVTHQEWIVDQPAYDEAVTELHAICNSCGADLTIMQREFGESVFNEHGACFFPSWHDEPVVTGYIHHEERGHNETVVDELAWEETVVDEPAWEETVVEREAWDETVRCGWKCSVCGAVKD